MSVDVSIFHFFNKLSGHFVIFDKLVVFLAEYLQYFLVFGFLLFLYFCRSSNLQKIHILWMTLLSASIARIGIASLIRYFYHRPRPFLTLESNKLISESAWFYSDYEWSFPSGHSAFFFALATMIYCYNRKWGVGFFIAALLMNVSRIIAGVHYPSDILGGMCVGVLTSVGLYWIVEKKKLTLFHRK